MSIKEDARIFVGGLSWDTTGRQLQDAFSRFGKVLESEVLRERDTGCPRGFGFVTFADRRAMEDAIAEMHGQELDGQSISVNKAEPKMGSYHRGYDYHRSGGGGYSSGGRGGYHGSNDRPPPMSSSDCFKCGRPGHWARECPSAGGSGGRSRFSSGSSRFGDDGGGDRFGGGDRYGDQYMDDRYDGGRNENRGRVDNRDSRYSGGRDRYGSDRYGIDRYSSSGDRYYGGGGGGGGNKYGGVSDRYPRNGYGKVRGYDRDGPRGGGPIHYEGGGGYRERPAPYDRLLRGGRPLPYDR